jgi:hypothetical protein
MYDNLLLVSPSLLSVRRSARSTQVEREVDTWLNPGLSDQERLTHFTESSS